MDEKAKKILQIINSSGGEARVVGGYVRDHIVSIETDDIDISTTTVPEKTTDIFKSKGYSVIPTGIDFGTVTVVFEGKNFEITTLRKDMNCDGRHARVEYSKDFEEDAGRRDFTFNALYMDIDENIHDYFNGRKDLEDGAVRFIGDARERIKEDYLRILRYFRFHAKYGESEFLGDQLEACVEMRKGLEKISGERIRQEMMKLLSFTTCYDSIKAMIDNGIMSVITSFDKELFNVDNIKSLSSLQLKKYDPVTSFAAITKLSFNSNNAEQLFEKWRLSKKEKQFLIRLINSRNVDLKDDYNFRNMFRINGKYEFEEYMKLALCDGRISLNEYNELSEQAGSLIIPDFPLSSEELIARGVKPGKKLGILLKEAEEIWERAGYSPDGSELMKKIGL